MEALTREVLHECLTTLAVSFPQRGLTPQQAEQRANVYRMGLQGVDADALRTAVKWCIQDDQYFPKVARLRELAKRYTRDYGTKALTGEMHPLWCRGCQAKAVLTERWRPKITEKGHHIKDDKGRIALESFTRHHCACSPECRWTPDGPDDPWMTPRM